MNYIYKNNTNRIICYYNYYWLPDEELVVPFQVPDELGLTCIQEGKPHDPVLFHDDFSIAPNNKISVSLNVPLISHNVALTIQEMSAASGVECRFNSENNLPVPIDVRGFNHVLSWQLCSKLFFFNPTDITANISVTALEVVS